MSIYTYFHKFKHTLNLIDISGVTNVGKRKYYAEKLADQVNIKNQHIRNL